LLKTGYLNSFKEIIARLLKDKMSAAALFILIAYLLAALCVECYGFYCAKTNAVPAYNQGNIDKRYQPPSSRNWMGTDYQGRDVFWRAVAGTSTAIKVGALASLLSALIGVALGAAAGYFGGWIDDFVVWIYSSFASMPTLLFILAFALLVSKGFLFPPLADFLKSTAETFGSDMGMMAIYLGIGLTGWVSLCRVVRGETMRLRELAYVQAAKAMGFSSMRIIIKHIIPNLFHLVIIYFTMRFAYAIMTEVIVSYLGLGVEMAPSWGVMIADGQERLWRGIWWEVAAATGFMFFLVLSLHTLGDSLRDILDPRLKN
jgi:peptide/nickel transport system permease protein